MSHRECSYTREQKIDMIMWYIQAESAIEVVGRFAFNYPNQPVPTAGTVLNTFNRFKKSGCINLCYECYKHDEDEEYAFSKSKKKRVQRDENVCAFVEMYPLCSSAVVSEELGVPDRTVRFILQMHGYKWVKSKDAKKKRDKSVSGEELNEASSTLTSEDVDSRDCTVRFLSRKNGYKWVNTKNAQDPPRIEPHREK